MTMTIYDRHNMPSFPQLPVNELNEERKTWELRKIGLDDLKLFDIDEEHKYKGLNLIYSDAWRNSLYYFASQIPEKAKLGKLPYFFEENKDGTIELHEDTKEIMPRTQFLSERLADAYIKSCAHTTCCWYNTLPFKLLRYAPIFIFLRTDHKMACGGPGPENPLSLINNVADCLKFESVDDAKRWISNPLKDQVNDLRHVVESLYERRKSKDDTILSELPYLLKRLHLIPTPSVSM